MEVLKLIKVKNTNVQIIKDTFTTFSGRGGKYFCNCMSPLAKQELRTFTLL